MVDVIIKNVKLVHRGVMTWNEALEYIVDTLDVYKGIASILLEACEDMNCELKDFKRAILEEVVNLIHDRNELEDGLCEEDAEEYRNLNHNIYFWIEILKVGMFEVRMSELELLEKMYAKEEEVLDEMSGNFIKYLDDQSDGRESLWDKIECERMATMYKHIFCREAVHYYNEGGLY